MYLTSQLQSTLKELDRATAKAASRFSAFSFIKARVSKTIEFYLTPKTTKTILDSIVSLPHSFIQFSRSHNQVQLGRLEQNLIDDFSHVLLMVHQSSDDIRQKFINDSHFANQIIETHSHGWSDCCENCGESVDLKFNATENTVVIANKKLAEAKHLTCEYRHKAEVTPISIATPSKILVMSDSLNDFLISNSHVLATEYKAFVKNTFSRISSSSERGRLMTSQFYAKHNIAHVYVGKGGFGVHEQDEIVKLLPNKAGAQQPPLSLRIDSLYLTMMDYSEFTAFCHQLEKSTYQVLKTLNANIVQLKHRNIDIIYQLNNGETNAVKLELRPAKASEMSVTAKGMKTA